MRTGAAKKERYGIGHGVTLIPHRYKPVSIANM
jgi:hypothetical protein